MFRRRQEGLVDPDAVPEPPDEPITNLAICGSWATIVCCARLRKGEDVDRLLTAPPSIWSTPTRPTT